MRCVWVQMPSVWSFFQKARAMSPLTRPGPWWRHCRKQWLPWACLSTQVFHIIMARVERCGLSMAQLHGRESTGLAARLKTEGVGVIKALFVDGKPGFDDASGFEVDGYLVECAKGPLPGGNAMAWDWGAARDFGHRQPLVLAGGLSPDNVAEAICAALPAAIDVSSGVEMSPGRKDPHKVARLIAAVQGTADQYAAKMIQPVFRPKGQRPDA